MGAAFGAREFEIRLGEQQQRHIEAGKVGAGGESSPEIFWSPHWNICLLGTWI